MTALEAVKSVQPGQETLILFMDDPIARRVMVAWQEYRPPLKDSPLKKNETPDEARDRLWQIVLPIDFERLALIAGVPTSKASRAFTRLLAARLLWPDGSLPPQALKLLRGVAGSFVDSLIPRRYTPPPQRPPQQAAG